MAATYADLVNEILDLLHGTANDLEQVTELTQNISTTDLTFNVADATQISRGLVEVDDELLFVKQTDRSVNSVTLTSFGRGFRRSTAATHSNGTMIVNNPLFPRTSIKAAIGECLSAISTQLFAVATDETHTAGAAQITYSLPATTVRVVQVEWQSIGPSGEWIQARRWKFDPNADTTAYPTGKSIDIFDSMVPGRAIKVTYALTPSALVNDNDTLTGIGLSDSVRDIIVYGAAARLLFGIEAGRLGTNAVEQSDRAKVSPAGAAVSVAKNYMAMYEMRVAAERDQLLALYSTSTHTTR